MSGGPGKDFAAIREDHAFFDAHATEAAADVRACLPLLAPLLEGAGPVRMLDYGCGNGKFSSRLHSTLFIPPERLHLSLVEPDQAAIRRAYVGMLDFTAHPILAGVSLPPGLSDAFDVALANHVFYYVPDLEGELGKVLGSLASPGLFLATLAGEENSLVRVWRAGFALAGEPVPYRTAEDFRAALARLGRTAEERPVEYEVAFPDSEENRLRLLRFLFADHFARLPREGLLGLLAPFADGGRIVIRTGHTLFIVRA